MNARQHAELEVALQDFLFALALDLPDAQSLEDPTTLDARFRWNNFITLKAAVRNLYLAKED